MLLTNTKQNNLNKNKSNNKMWLAIITIFVPINLLNGFHIEITRNDNLIYNNQKVI
jgi:hypothetical protein